MNSLNVLNWSRSSSQRACLFAASGFAWLAGLNVANAHICGESEIFIRVGQIATYRILTDVAEEEMSRYEWTATVVDPIPDPGGGEPMPNPEVPVAVFPPDAFSSFNFGEFFLKGDAVGSATVVFDWSYAPFNAAGQCSVNVVVLPSSSAPPETASNYDSSAITGDPVNLFTGELIFAEGPDLDLGGPMPLYFERYYASGLGRDGLVDSRLGPNWMHNFDMRLIQAGGQIDVAFHQGRRIQFANDGSEWTLSGGGTPFQLEESGDVFRLADPRDNRIYTFNNEGRLTSISDGKGNTHTLTYEGIVLAEVSDGLGRSLTFNYAGFQQLASVSDGMRTLQFSYAFWGGLTEAKDALNQITQYFYDTARTDSALVTAVKVPKGNTPFTQTYDAEERVEKQFDADGNEWTFDYEWLDGDILKTTVTNPSANARVFRHDAAGRLVGYRDEQGAEMSAGYNAEGRRNHVSSREGVSQQMTFHAPSGGLLSASGPAGATLYTYGERADGNLSLYDVTGIQYPDGSGETFLYDNQGNLISWIDRAGEEWLYDYNSRGQILMIVAPTGATEWFNYFENGLVESVTDPDENVTSFEYDVFGRRTKMTLPDGSTRLFTYDPNDGLLSITDEGGATTAMSYDANGNLATLTDPLNQVTAYAYDDQDRLVSVTDPRGNSDARTYDFTGRLTSVTDRNGNTTTLAFNSRGFLETVTDPSGEIWSFERDSEGILSSTTDPLGKTMSFLSDNLGRLGVHAGEDDRVSEVVRNETGGVAEVRDESGRVTRFANDVHGRTTEMTLPGGLTALYERDPLSGITAITDPESQEWLFNRDARGRVISSVDPLGRATTYVYDNRNRVAEIEFPGALGSVTFTHDAAGNTTSKSFSDGTELTYSFDAQRRLISANGLGLTHNANGRITGSNGIEIHRDPEERITEIVLAPGKSVTYAYDERNFVTSITDWLGGETTFGYDAAGRLTSMTRPNGTAVSYAHGAGDYVTGIVEENLYSVTISRDPKGYIKEVDRSGAIGPVLSDETRVQSFNAASAADQYTFDAMGRRTADDRIDYTWNLASNLTGYTRNESEVSFTYDGAGHRLSRTEGGTTRAYVWNYALGLPSVSEVRENGSPLRYYVHTPSGELLYSIEETDGTRRFHHYDEAGNTVLLTGDQGNVLAEYAYTAYGRAGGTGAVDNLFTFHGKYGVMEEPGGELYYMRARYYDAVSQQFISKDSVSSCHPRGLNPYQFAYGDPVRFADPLGLDILTPQGPAPRFDPFDPFGDRQRGCCDEPEFFGINSGYESIADKAPPAALPGGTLLVEKDDCDCPEKTGTEADFVAAGASTGFEAAEQFFKRQGRRIIENGRTTGNFRGAATAGSRAAKIKVLGTVASGVFGAVDEYQKASSEGQSTGTTIVRTGGAFAVDAAIGVASAPIAIVDAATGGNFSSCIKQNIRIGTVLAGGAREERAYNRAVNNNEYGCVVRVTHQAGEAWAERGVTGMFKDLGYAFGIINP